MVNQWAINGQSLAINYLLSGHIAPASISTRLVCLAIESLALLRKNQRRKNTKTPLGLQLAASDQHARWPGVLHCPHSKGRLSLTQL